MPVLEQEECQPGMPAIPPRAFWERASVLNPTRLGNGGLPTADKSIKLELLNGPEGFNVDVSVASPGTCRHK